MLWLLEIQTAIAEIPSRRIMRVYLSTSEKKIKTLYLAFLQTH